MRLLIISLAILPKMTGYYAGKMVILQFNRVARILSHGRYCLTTRYLAIHRDLSLKNIMLDKSGQVYLIDFGNSTSINSQNTEVRGLPSIGTAPFYAPQSIGNVPERDYYALGMLIYAMYGGKLIKGQDDKQVKKAIEEELDHLTSVPEWRRVVLKRCWNGEYKDSATLSKALRLPERNPPEINAPERQLRPDWHPYPC